MKTLVIIGGVLVAIVVALSAVGWLARLGMRDERKTLDEGVARLQQDLRRELKLEVGVSYEFEKSLTRGLKHTEVTIAFPTFPPTADPNKILQRTAELAYQNMSWVTDIIIVGRIPGKPAPFRVRVRRDGVPPHLPP